MRFLASISSMLGLFQRSATPTLNDVQAELLKAMTASVTTGITVDAAMSIPAVWLGVCTLSNDAGRARKRGGNGIVDAIVRSPNSRQPASEFFRSMTLRAVCLGNAYARIIYDQAGIPVGLVPIDVTTLEWNQDRTAWTYRANDGSTLSPSDVFHLRAPGFDGIVGLSPIRTCGPSTRVAVQAIELALEVFSNGGQSKIAAVGPGPYNSATTKLILDSYAANHTGPGSGRRPLVLWDNMQLHKIGATLDDALWADVSAFSVEEVGRILGIPPALLGSPNPGAFGRFEDLARAYLWTGLSPWLEAWASEAEHKLGARIDFDVSRLSLPSMAETATACRTFIECAILNPNECRELIDKPPYPGGEVYSQAKNLGTGGGTSNAGVDTSVEATGA
jgi:HK97 family phage portal protein